MLSKILTKNNLKILISLLREEASLSDLARKTKITKARVFYSLKELKKGDIVRRKIRGKTHIYSFNFLHPQVKEILKAILLKKKTEYNTKLKALPALVDTFLSTSLKKKYQGCIFFGSSIEEEKFKDIDLFILLQDFKQKGELKNKLRLLDKRVSPILGTKKELKKGINSKDMLYLNIFEGLPFSCESFVLETKYYEHFLRRTDIQERFILGYREILSCVEFKETAYTKKHLAKGIMDIIYATLNYFNLSPRNDAEAMKLFKEKIRLKPTGKVNEAIALANKLARLIL